MVVSVACSLVIDTAWNCRFTLDKLNVIFTSGLMVVSVNAMGVKYRNRFRTDQVCLVRGWRCIPLSVCAEVSPLLWHSTRQSVHNSIRRVEKWNCICLSRGAGAIMNTSWNASSINHSILWFYMPRCWLVPDELTNAVVTKQYVMNVVDVFTKQIASCISMVFLRYVTLIFNFCCLL